ncbi:alpha-L-rhamnosidase N-terminal domain-containing protein [Gaoshiqia sp. Z1-71]|uniref:alpha-L-rhamnosidase-related protein n=1 Tax=Gaoshiqia hydrogeniformans TaxID=3290090 RepID=UPI003BF861DC
MKNIIFLALFLLGSMLNENVYSQIPVAGNNRKNWNANWIAAHGVDGKAYGVYYFRKNLTLREKPERFVVHVSADNRYKLYVNGELVSLGPARGDIYFWNFETVDLAPQLKAGENHVAALVWNESQLSPEAQVSVRTGFILQGNSEKEEILNTNDSWLCLRDNGYSAAPSIFSATTGEMVDLNQSVMNWNDPLLDDSNWPKAANLFQGNLKGDSDGFGWMLVASEIPQMEMTYDRIPVLRKAEGIDVPTGFPATKTSVTIPAHTRVTMLLDQTYLTNAYLTLNFDAGKDARIGIKYAETLIDEMTPYGARKSNRNEVEDKIFYGSRDSLISNGQTGQSYTTLYWRTFRYIQLSVQTEDEPLTITDIYGTFTGYPFKQESAFNADQAEIKQILDIGWKTARLCAMETYWDCPYYEQLQYIGDTRIQAMITYYNSSDDRLARHALTLMDHSRLTEGVTLSRYPSKGTQVISTFSLWYIGMLHDYWMYRPDAEFVKEKLTGMRAILEFFGKYQQADGSLKNTPYWNFVDWANGEDWFVGVSPKGTDGSSAIIDMQLLWAYQWAAELETNLGMPAYSKIYAEKAGQLKKTIVSKYWDASGSLFSDTNEKKHFSQHANSLAILTGLVGKDKMKSVCNSLLTDQSLTECTLYFSYYLYQALVKGGMGNDYLNWLDVWRNAMKAGMTTWPEYSNLEFTRSECHAWSSSPNIEFYRTVLGIDSHAPGFSSVKIEPHLGGLTKVSGEIPHPNGKISVKYLFLDSKWRIEIYIPVGISGIFIWEGKTYKLKAGGNSFII